MPATKSLGMGRQPRAGVIGMLPLLTGLAGPSAWHPGDTRPCPPCSGGCPSPGPWSPLDPCTQEKERLGRAFSPLHPCDSVMSLFLEQTPSKAQAAGGHAGPGAGGLLAPRGSQPSRGWLDWGPGLPLEGQALPEGARLGAGDRPARGQTAQLPRARRGREVQGEEVLGAPWGARPGGGELPHPRGPSLRGASPCSGAHLRRRQDPYMPDKDTGKEQMVPTSAN